MTGSNDIRVDHYDGLGIVGGEADHHVDTGEWIEFDFGVARYDVAYRFWTSRPGERLLEAFGPWGDSLGVVSHEGGSKELADDFPGELISRFRLTSVDSPFTVSGVSFGDSASLTVGNAEFRGPVGNTRPLNDLTIEGGETSVIDAPRAAASTINFNSPVSLSRATALVADEINLNGGEQSVGGGGVLTLSPATAAVSVVIGGNTDIGETALDLNDTDLAALADGFASIEIGSASAGDFELDTATFRDPLTLISGGEIRDGAGVDIDIPDDAAEKIQTVGQAIEYIDQAQG